MPIQTASESMPKIDGSSTPVARISPWRLEIAFGGLDVSNLIATATETASLVTDKFPCPCCGHLVHDQVPGFHQVCPICGWEDDLTQLRFPEMPGSSNTVSLAEAQQNYRDYGASERRNRGNTRAPVDGEPVEQTWRPLDPAQDNVEHPSRGANYADSYPWPDTTVLYYWRSTYWRRLVS